MGAIPQGIYKKIQEALAQRVPVAVTLLCPGDGTITEALISPVEIVPATPKH